MSSIKQIIINAIIKVSGENPALNREGEATAVEARDDFIRELMLELFPEDAAIVTIATTETAVPAKSPKEDATQKAARKVAKVAKAEKDAAKAAAAAAKEAEKAAKAAEKEAAKAEKAAAKKSPAKSPKKEAKAEVVAPVEESPKKVKKVKKAKEESPKKVKEESPKKVKKAKEDSPKKVKKVKEVAKPAEDANLPKMDPTWRKHLKKADKEGAKEREPELLTYLNALTKEEFNAKKAEDHVAAFLASRATAAPAEAPAQEEDDGKVPADLTVVEFEGKDYFVNPETKRVYEGEGEYDEEVGWTSYKAVGYVGMAAFETMEV